MIGDRWTESERRKFMHGILRCVFCRGVVGYEAASQMRCVDCGQSYQLYGKTVGMLPDPTRAEVQVRAEQHYQHTYSSLQTFGDHWIGADQVLEVRPKTVLEIGVGQGILSNYLRFLGINIFTVDIDCSLSPDVLADVRNLPFEGQSFDVVCCLEVMEHVAYPSFVDIVRTCFATARRRLVFSVPDVKYVLALDLRFEIGTRNLIDRAIRISFPRLHRRHLGKHPEHYWEIGRTGFTLARVLRDLSHVEGVKRLRHFRSRASNSIRFFVLDR